MTIQQKERFTMANIGEVFKVQGNEYLIIAVPTRKNHVNYKMVSTDGQIYKIHQVVLDIDGELLRTDDEWLNAYHNGSSKNSLTGKQKMLVSGDEVVVNAPESKELNGKTAYVVKVNAKTVQIVVPHVGAWNVSPNLLVQKS